MRYKGVGHSGVLGTLDAYLHALLIFFDKATLYFKMMNKPLPQLMREFIG
jgi:hypothetical protein